MYPFDDEEDDYLNPEYEGAFGSGMRDFLTNPQYGPQVRETIMSRGGRGMGLRRRMTDREVRQRWDPRNLGLGGGLGDVGRAPSLSYVPEEGRRRINEGRALSATFRSDLGQTPRARNMPGYMESMRTKGSYAMPNRPGFSQGVNQGGAGKPTPFYKFARGTGGRRLVTEPTLALIGEDGPETLEVEPFDTGRNPFPSSMGEQMRGAPPPLDDDDDGRSFWDQFAQAPTTSGVGDLLGGFKGAGEKEAAGFTFKLDTDKMLKKMLAALGGGAAAHGTGGRRVIDRPTLALYGEDGPEMVERDTPSPREEFLARMFRGEGLGDGEDLEQQIEAQTMLDEDEEPIEPEDYGLEPGYDDDESSAGPIKDLEREEPEGFWENFPKTSGNIDLRHSGAGGALLGLAGLLANAYANKKQKPLREAAVRNKERRESARKQQETEDLTERALKLERVRQLGAARREQMKAMSKTGTDGMPKWADLPGVGRVSTSSPVYQDYQYALAERGGTPLRDRTKDPTNASTVSSMEENETERKWKSSVDRWRRGYWEKRFPTDVQYATFANSPIPGSAEREMIESPEVKQAYVSWQVARLVRMARQARTEEDLQDLENALSDSPGEVDSHERVVSAIRSAVGRIR